MKKFIYMILLAVFVLPSFTACSDQNEGNSILVGEWCYSEDDVEVYMAFSKNGKFELYQKMGEEFIRYYYTGTYEFDGEILTGMYTGYIPFAHDYKVTYTKKSIPEEVKTHFIPVTKSAEVAPVPFL